VPSNAPSNAPSDSIAPDVTAPAKPADAVAWWPRVQVGNTVVDPQALRQQLVQETLERADHLAGGTGKVAPGGAATPRVTPIHLLDASQSFVKEELALPHAPKDAQRDAILEPWNFLEVSRPAAAGPDRTLRAMGHLYRASRDLLAAAPAPAVSRAQAAVVPGAPDATSTSVAPEVVAASAATEAPAKQDSSVDSSIVDPQTTNKSPTSGATSTTGSQPQSGGSKKTAIEEESFQ
jgi:hypothetical protein